MIVRFTLQGDGKRLDKAIAAINEGTKRSTGVRVSASPAAIEPGLKTFTIVDWTSSGRPTPIRSSSRCGRTTA